MKDLTKQFNTAASTNVLWSVSIFFQVVEILKKQKIEISYWEGEENWAIILRDEKIVGYIWKRYPLIALEKENAQQIKSLLGEIDYINYLFVDSLFEEKFCLNYKELKINFKDYFNFNSFTIEELWFATNSV